MRLIVDFLNKRLAAPLGQVIFGMGLAKNKRLCAELSWMAYRDQKVRKAWAGSKKYHTVRLKTWLARTITRGVQWMPGSLVIDSTCRP